MATRSTLTLVIAAKDVAGRAFASFRQRLARLRRGLKLIAVASGAAAVASVKFASDFSNEMRRLETLVGLSREQVQGFEQDILRLAPAVGKSPRELAKAMFAITSAGLRGQEALSVLEQAAKASAVGLGDMTAIGRTATAALNAFGDSGLTAEKAVDTMVATIRTGNLEAESLASVLGRVIGIADSLGVSFEDLNAFIATFTRLGVPAEVAVTSLRGLLAGLLKTTSEQEAAFAKLDTTAEETIERLGRDGLARTLIDLVDRAEEMDVNIAELIPNVRALSGALGTAGSQAESFEDVQRQVRESLGLTNEGFKAQRRELSQLIEEFKATLQVAAVQFGEQLQPLVRDALRAMQQNMDEVLTFAVQGIGFLTRQLGRAVSFFEDHPVAGGTGLIGLVFFGPTGAAVIGTLGAAIDKLIEKIGGPQTVLDAHIENIRKANREAQRLQRLIEMREARGLGGPEDEVTQRLKRQLETQRQILEQNSRALTMFGDELQREAEEAEGALGKVGSALEGIGTRLENFEFSFNFSTEGIGGGGGGPPGVEDIPGALAERARPQLEVPEVPIPTEFDFDARMREMEDFTPPTDEIRVFTSEWKKLGSAMAATAENQRTVEQINARIVNQLASDFAGAFETAAKAAVTGSQSIGEAFKNAMLNAVASAARAKAKFYAAQAVAALGQGILGDPRGFAAAAKFAAAAAAFGALAGALSGLASGGGGAGGGAGAGSAAGFQQQQEGRIGEGRQETVLVLEGDPFLDLSNPETQRRLGRVLSDLSGRRVVVQRGRS